VLKLSLWAGSAGLLLGSATPPPPATPESEPAVQLAEAAAAPPKLVYEPQPLADTVAFTVAPEPPRMAEPAADPTPGGVRIVVSIPLQKAYVFDDGELLWTSPVSTGKRGYETPTGSFTILQKKVHHRSTTYDDAPMPYMQRLTWQGVALHAGRVPGYPASHGCIRLPRQFAKKLYAITDHGTTVTITNRKPASPEAAIEMT
jgi:lipoprotein-anchoring transpeptidase ErfK/SrfK